MKKTKRTVLGPKDNDKQVQFMLAEMFLDYPDMAASLGFDVVRIDGKDVSSKVELEKMRREGRKRRMQ